MSKSSLILGLLAAVGLHVMLMGSAFEPTEAPQPQHEPAMTLVRLPEPLPEVPVPQIPSEPESVAEPDPPREPEPVAVPEPMTPPEIAETPEPIPSPPDPLPERPAMQETQIASAEPEEPLEADNPGETSIQNAPEGESPLPSMRIEWESPRQLLDVAETLGMVVVAMNNAREIVGQVVASSGPTLVPWDDDLRRFSRRGRLLGRNFFGQPILRSAPSAISEYWILLPPAVEAELLAVQLEEIRNRGLNATQVQAIDGRFQRVGRTYQLVITWISDESRP